MNRIFEQIENIEKLFQMNNQKTSIVDILKKEIKKLKELNKEYSEYLNEKKIIEKDESKKRTRYYLKDGSTYVVNKKYRYLYDAKTKTITYEFKNGQVERTFSNGLKEIRYNDGTIVIHNGEHSYECLNMKK